MQAGEFESFGKLAREFGVSPASVSNYAKQLGIDPLDAERSRTKKATETRMTYDAARRIEIIDAALEKVAELVAAQDGAKDVSIQQLAIALATLIDKRRQEDDLPVSTHEHRHRGHVTHGHVDLSRFNDDELEQLERLASRYEGAET